MGYDENGQYQDDFDAPVRRRSTAPAPWWVRVLASQRWRGVGLAIRVLAGALFVICAAGPKS